MEAESKSQPLGPQRDSVKGIKSLEKSDENLIVSDIILNILNLSGKYIKSGDIKSLVNLIVLVI